MKARCVDRKVKDGSVDQTEGVWGVVNMMLKYIENLCQNIARKIFMILALSLTIGFSVPENYYERPSSVVIVGGLISSLLYFWKKVLGSSIELDSETFNIDCDSRLLKIVEQQSDSLCCAQNMTFSSSENCPFAFVYNRPCSTEIIVRSNEGYVSYNAHRCRVVKIISVELSNLIVSADESGLIMLWNMDTLQSIWSKQGHQQEILSLTISSLSSSDMNLNERRNMLLSCCRGGNALAWDLKTGFAACEKCGIEVVESWQWPLDIVAQITAATSSLSQDCCHRVAVGSASGSVCTWRSNAGTVDTLGSKKNTLMGHYGSVTAIAIIDKIKPAVLISASFDWTIRVWDFDTGIHLRTFHGHSGSIDCLATWVDEGTSLIVSAGKDATIRIWDLGTGTLCRTMEGHTQEIVSILIPSGFGIIGDCKSKRKIVIVSSCCDQSVRIWNLHRLIQDLKWGRRKRLAFLYVSLMIMQESHPELLTDSMRSLYLLLTVNDLRQLVATFL